MDFVPITEEDRRVMLKAMGAASFEDLLSRIPKFIPRADLNVPPGLSESSLLRLTGELARRNVTTQSHVSFLGAGSYEHLIPSVVRYITSRGEFLTAYTPYQAEASQGTLQAMYEYQSLICELTGMEVANASLYDGASALAEGCLLALRETGRGKLCVARTVHPEYRKTVSTCLKHSGVQIEELSFKEGATDLQGAESQIGPDTAAVVVQMPNAFGCLEPVKALEKAAHAAGALFLVVVNPISLGILQAPGSYGADVVVGEGQPLGTDLQYGGPYLGLFACREKFLRKMPGRVVGMTRDAHGRRGFVLTLQTREQHIRRSKATSNICTNEAMMALGAAVYLASLGKEGMRELALQNLFKARYCFEELTQKTSLRPLLKGPFFNEFAVTAPRDPERLNEALLKEGFLGGFPLKRWEPNLANGWLLCVTEARTKEEIDRFVEAVKKCLR
ncbi:MAG: aminomethyl-transferring glycine dehydrogenase subunit GcvPA [Candidatus Omnitrophica bacterium]|nr:aminomethyl-transferring glycine dehydrogenase subunit GcvPA [Candidatus Omnitrophota bacterium]